MRHVSRESLLETLCLGPVGFVVGSAPWTLSLTGAGAVGRAVSGKSAVGTLFVLVCPPLVLRLVTWQICWHFFCFVFFFFFLRNVANPPTPHHAAGLTDVARRLTWKEWQCLIPPEKSAGVLWDGRNFTSLISGLSHRPSEQNQLPLRPGWMSALTLTASFPSEGAGRAGAGRRSGVLVTALKPSLLSVLQ